MPSNGGEEMVYGCRSTSRGSAAGTLALMLDRLQARFPAQSEQIEKVLRYCGVSVVNVITGQTTLLVTLAGFGIDPIPAQVLAASVSAGPAYVLSRRWVWRQSGRDSLRQEILPFWLLTLAGLGFALTALALVEQVSDAPLVLMLTSLVAYGLVWVAKYLVLDLVTWRNRPLEADEIHQSAPEKSDDTTEAAR